MALLATQVVTRAGLRVDNALVAASAGGDTFVPDRDTSIVVNNGGGTAVTVTVVTPGTVIGLPIADVSVSVPAGQRFEIGPFPYEFFADVSGFASITYSSVTSVTVGVFRRQQP